MKRIFIICVMLVSLLLSSACTKTSDIEIEDSSLEINQNSETKNEEQLEESLNSTDEEVENTSNISVEEQELVKNLMFEIINNSDTIEVTSNLFVPLTNENKQELLDILDISSKTVISSDNSFGVYGVRLSKENSDEYMLFTSLQEGENFMMIDGVYRLILDIDTVELLTDFFVEIGNDSIKNTNVKLEEYVDTIINEIVISEVESEYSVTKDNVKALSETEKEEIKKLLNINDWQMYTGNYSLIHTMNSESVIFANRLDIQDTFEYYQTLTLVHHDGVYAVKLNLFEGPGSGLNLYITKEIYDNVIAYANTLKN